MIDPADIGTFVVPTFTVDWEGAEHLCNWTNYDELFFAQIFIEISVLFFHYSKHFLNFLYILKKKSSFFARF